jgi:hypothetical protein
MKNKWANRVYLELFSGLESVSFATLEMKISAHPLKVIEHEFTKFIFIEMNAPVAEALAQRLEPFPNLLKLRFGVATAQKRLNKFVFGLARSPLLY